MAPDEQLVSIVTPAFNAERFIRECIDSVLAQTHRALEMLVVDDCSRDKTAEIVRSYSSRDPRIRLISRESNGGPAAARNTALKAASGRFIAFLDSDDLWTERKLEEQLQFMKETDSTFSFTGYRRISEQGAFVSERVRVPTSLNYSGLLKNTAIATTTVLIDRSKTGPLEMKQTYYDDFALWLSVLKRGFTAHGLQKDLARYRVVEGSWSRRKWRSAIQVWKAYRQVEGLSWPYSVWCFLHYAFNATRKHSR